MKILSIYRYGDDRERLVIEFETKYDNGLKIEINSDTKEITVESNGATIYEVEEAIEIIRYGKLLIEL